MDYFVRQRLMLSLRTGRSFDLYMDYEDERYLEHLGSFTELEKDVWLFEGKEFTYVLPSSSMETFIERWFPTGIIKLDNKSTVSRCGVGSIYR